MAPLRSLAAPERTLPAALSAPPGPSSLESDVAGQPPLPMLLDDLSDQEQDSTPNPLGQAAHVGAC